MEHAQASAAPAARPSSGTRLKRLAYRALAASGVARGLHGWGFPQQVSILMYHAVVRAPLPVYDWCFLAERAFVRQLEYLKRTFAVVPLAEAVQRMREGSIRRPTAVLTFDDGFYNNYSVMFPHLREAGLPATIFLTTGLLDTDETAWFCRLNDALTRATKPALEWRDRRLPLGGPREKAAAAKVIAAALKELPQRRLVAELADVVRGLGLDPDGSVARDSPFRMLDQDAIEIMGRSGLVEFGAHTRSHAILSRLPADEQRDEVADSVAAVTRATGRRCVLFAYPNGERGDYDRDSMAALEASGVTAGVTTVEGPNDAATPPLELRRYGIGANTTPEEFKISVHHLRSKIGARVP